MVCENTLENCRLFTNYSLLKVRFKLGCVKSVLRLFEARKDSLGWICDISFTVILRYSFALLTCLFSDIQWSNCFESIRAKLKFSFFFFSFHCLKQASKTHWPRKGKSCVWPKLCSERNDCKPDTSFSFKTPLIGNDSDFSDTSSALGLWMCDSVQKQTSFPKRTSEAS